MYKYKVWSKVPKQLLSLLVKNWLIKLGGETQGLDLHCYVVIMLDTDANWPLKSFPCNYDLS